MPHKGEGSSEETQIHEQEAAVQKAFAAFSTCVTGYQVVADGARVQYTVGDFYDSSDRYAEVRFSPIPGDFEKFQLNANTGDALALIDLYKQLTEKGVHVARLVTQPADRETQEALTHFLQTQRPSENSRA